MNQTNILRLTTVLQGRLNLRIIPGIRITKLIGFLSHYSSSTAALLGRPAKLIAFQASKAPDGRCQQERPTFLRSINKSADTRTLGPGAPQLTAEIGKCVLWVASSNVGFLTLASISIYKSQKRLNCGAREISTFAASGNSPFDSDGGSPRINVRAAATECHNHNAVAGRAAWRRQSAGRTPQTSGRNRNRVNDEDSRAGRERSSRNSRTADRLRRGRNPR